VHVTFPKDSVFLDSREPAKASVLVRVRPGVQLLPQNVIAISHLVASAVEGLSPDAVSIVDMQGNLLGRHRKPSLDGSDSADSALEYKDQVEKDLTAKVEATMEPLLGEGRFRVGVTADCDFSTSEQTDEVYDPNRSVMSSSQKTEDLSQGSGPGGVPGTPSNLPRSQIKAQAAAAAGPGAPSVSRQTESVAFQTSRTVRQVKVPRGVIKRISAALLIDQDVEWQGKGNQRKRVLIPPSAEKLKAIHDVVAGVLGISTDRGDQLVIETLPFEQTRNTEDEAADTATKRGAPAKLTVKDLLTDKKILIGAGAGLLFIVLLIGFILRKSKASAVSAQLREQPAILPGESGSVAKSSGGSKQVEGAGMEAAIDTAEAATRELEEASPTILLPEMTSHAKTLLSQLRKAIAKDPDTAANVIRSWMEEV
jgi:flagellar M-ring protein FliF